MPVILVADIDRGGVFAAIYGTLALLQDHERWRVKASSLTSFAVTGAFGLEKIESHWCARALGDALAGD
jgi:adenosylcobyric acid synthase